MNKSFYYIECVCIKDVKFPNTEFHVGDIVYFNRNAMSDEMYLYNVKLMDGSIELKNANRYRYLGSRSRLPFTRKKNSAKKWQLRRYPESIVRSVENLGDFKCTIHEIKLTYTEEE